MADTDLRVINKAIELMKHTYQLTSNCNRYPKKYRHSLVDRMQILSMDIYEFLLEANRINNVTDKRLRCETITADGKVIRKLKNQNKRNAQRRYLKMARLVAEGKLSRKKFDASYNAWKNHISHGNCYGLIKAFDEKISRILKEVDLNGRR